MNRAAIETKIEEVLAPIYKDGLRVKALTDLFIQLSTERCEEQKEICYNEIAFDEHGEFDIILNAPLPALD